MINLNKISQTIIILIVIYKVLAKNQNISPSIDINEINNYKYQIDIDKLIIPSNTNQNNQNLNKILIKSVHGQTYQCDLPDILNSLNDKEEEYDDEEAVGINGSSSIRKNNELNFTLINERIVSYLDGLKKMNVCVYKNMGWWTYEFCFGSHANQYHKLRMI
jgi:hypothetical protein